MASQPLKAKLKNLDPSFGKDGIRLFGENISIVKGMTTLENSKLLVAGQSADGRFFVTRLHEDGTTDTDFGVNGLIMDYFIPGEGDRNIALKAFEVADDKTLVIGTAESNVGVVMAVARYDKGGKLDPTFGDQGKKLLYQPSSLTDNEKKGPKVAIASVEANSASALPSQRSFAISPQGRIILSFFFLDTFISYTFCLNKDGKFEEQFNGTGWVKLSDRLFTGDVYSTLTLSNEQVILIGSFVNAQRDFDIYLVRYNADGQMDTTFADAGIATLNQYPNFKFRTWIERPEGGFIGLGGTRVAPVAAPLSGHIISVKPDGTHDNSFNATPIKGVFRWFAGAIDKERIVAFGSTEDPKALVVARYLADGQLDSEFGDGSGWLRLEISAPDVDSPTDVASENSRITLSGYNNAKPQHQTYVARLLG